MSAKVFVLFLRDGERVSDALMREAARLGVASQALLDASAADLARLKKRERPMLFSTPRYGKQEADRRAWEERCKEVAPGRETPAARAAAARALVAAIK